MAKLKSSRPTRYAPVKSLSELDKPETARLTVNMEANLYKLLRMTAIEEQTTVTAIIIKLVTAHVRWKG